MLFLQRSVFVDNLKQKLCTWPIPLVVCRTGKTEQKKKSLAGARAARSEKQSNKLPLPLNILFFKTWNPKDQLIRSYNTKKRMYHYCVLLEMSDIIDTFTGHISKYVLRYVCIATHVAKVWINRVRLPILHVAS